MGWKGLDPLRGLRVSWIVLPVCLLLSLAGWAWMRDRVAREVGEALQRRGDLLRVTVEEHTRTYAATLQEAALLVQVHGGNRLEVLEEFLDELPLRGGFSGFYGVGYAEREPPNPAFEDRIQTVAIAAMDDHRSHLVGLDHMAIPPRAEAILRARDTGRIAITQPLNLRVDSPSAAPGSVVIYLPVYRGFSTPTDTASRASKLSGVIFSPLPLRPFIEALGPALEDGVLIHIRDEVSGLGVYQSEGWASGEAHSSSDLARSRVQVGGRIWTVQLQATPKFLDRISYHRTGQWLVVLLMVSFLFFATSAALEGARGRAVRMAEVLSAESRATATRIQALLEAMPDLVFLLDLEGRFLDFHAPPGLEPILPPGAFLGRTPSEVLPSEVAQAMERGLSQIRLSGRPVALEYTLGDGPALRHFEGRLVSAGPDRVLGLVRDVTERHQMEWALSQARKSESLEMMAGGTAHDLNNLFQGLVGYLDLALADPPHSGDRTLLLQRMQGLLQRGIKLSGELLLYTGRGFRVRESLNLQALVAADASADSVRCESHEAEPRIEGDPNQIARLIRILVENALEATPKGSRKPHLLIDRIEVGQMEREEGVWPRTPDPGRYLMLQVEDEGEGITDEGLNQIFDPFYSTRGVGRGLGLSAALGIVRGHGGFIQVVSRRGEGTRIRVLFPVDPA